MSQITLSVVEAKKIALTLVEAHHFIEAISLLTAIHNATVLTKAELPTKKTFIIKATPAFKKKRNGYTWSPERKAAAAALIATRKAAKQLAKDAQEQPTYQPLYA